MAYLLFIRYLISGWKNIEIFRVSENTMPRISVSIIIPVRNDTENLLRLLQCMALQDYPPALYEVVVVDDHSDNPVHHTMTSLQDEQHNFSLICHTLPQDKTGKKEALRYGVLKSHCDHIIAVDADVQLSPLWLKTYATAFEERKADMIIGPLRIFPAKNILEKFQQFDVLSLVTAAAASTGHKNPILCNGANLGFTREAFLRYGDMNTKYTSGDDIFFMLHLKKIPKSSIVFLKSRDAMVYIEPNTTFSEFFRQRVRWASKSSGYKDSSIILTASFVLAYNLILLATGILSFFSAGYFLLFLSLFFFKFLADFFLFRVVSSFFNLSVLPLRLLLFEVFYAIYVSYIGIVSHFSGFQWKGRTYSQ